MSQYRCGRVLRRSVTESACARGTPVGWVAFLRIVLAAPRGAVDGNAVAKGVRMIRDEMMGWRDGASAERVSVHVSIGVTALQYPPVPDT